MEGIYYYKTIVGTWEQSWFGGDDRQARQKVARWIRLFWERRKAQNPGSIAHAINNDRPSVKIGRLYCESESCPIVPVGRYVMVEDFKLDAISKNEFLRVTKQNV